MKWAFVRRFANFIHFYGKLWGHSKREARPRERRSPSGARGDSD